MDQLMRQYIDVTSWCQIACQNSLALTQIMKSTQEHHLLNKPLMYTFIYLILWSFLKHICFIDTTHSLNHHPLTSQCFCHGRSSCRSKRTSSRGHWGKGHGTSPGTPPLAACWSPLSPGLCSPPSCSCWWLGSSDLCCKNVRYVWENRWHNPYIQCWTCGNKRKCKSAIWWWL